MMRALIGRALLWFIRGAEPKRQRAPFHWPEGQTLFAQDGKVFIQARPGAPLVEVDRYA